MNTEPVQVFVCGAPCDAGGPPERGGHVFNIEWESEDGLCGGFQCKCGMTNMAFDMWRGE